MAWYDDSWGFRVKVTVQASQITGDLTNFPTYVDLSGLPAGFFSNVQSSGADIRVTSSDETSELAREIVALDTVGSTGQLHFLASSLSSSVDTEFYIYYGNAEATEPVPSSTYGSESVWVNYDGVSHLEEDPSGTAPQMSDSTGNNNEGTSNGSMTSGDSVSAKLTKGLSFDGTDDTISYGGNFAPTSAWSVTGWVKTGTDGNSMFCKCPIGSSADKNGVCAYMSLGRIIVVCGDGTAISANASTDVGFDNDNAWHHFAVTKNGTSFVSYVDGAQAQSFTDTLTDGGATFLLGDGNRTNSGSWFYSDMKWTDELDEFRVINSELSADYISAEYANQNTPATFYTVGSQEEAPEPPTPPPTPEDDPNPSGGMGTRAIARRWPNEEGLTFGTTKQEGRRPHLKPRHSVVLQDAKIGL